MTQTNRNVAFCQKWVNQSLERNWGPSRTPNGYSLHLSVEVCRSYVLGAKPERVPEYGSYADTDGQPYQCAVDDETFAKLTTTGGSLRLYGELPSPLEVGN